MTTLQTTVNGKASQTDLNTTNSVVQNKAEATAVSNNVALIGALQTDVNTHTTDLSTLNTTVTNQGTTLNTLTGMVNTNQSNILGVIDRTEGIGLWPVNSGFYAFYSPSITQNASGKYALLVHQGGDVFINSASANLSFLIQDSYKQQINASTTTFNNTSTRI